MTHPEKNSIRKIAIIGPECTGKSELAEYLANHFDTSWVPEYARTYLDNLNRPYDEADLVKIAHGQVHMEDEWITLAKRVLICDTNLLVIKIWSEFKYKKCDKEILNLFNTRLYDLHLLTDIDIPWQSDPLREHPDKREQLYELYKTELYKYNIPFVEIGGSREQRRDQAISSILKMLTN